MKKSLLLLATAVVAVSGLKAEAYDFNNKIYGKAHVDFAYTIQPYTDVDNFRGDEFNTGHAFSFGGGYNVFYKYCDKIHPFAGAELLFRLPLNNYSGNFSYREFMMFHGKLGAKFNVATNISLLPYYIIGFNVSQLKTLTKTYNEASLSTGLGIDVLYKEKYSLGFEWRYSRMKIVEGSAESTVFAANNISFKFGYHFL